MSEAQRLFECFLRKGAAPEELVRQYDAACAALAMPSDALTERLIAARADLAAVELVRRRRDPRNGLTLRALLLLSLAEARSDCASMFLLESPSALCAWLELAVAPLCAAYRWMMGTWLLWRHERGL